MSRILSAQELLDRQKIEMEADAKAAEPFTLTDEDLRVLPVGTFTRLAEAASSGT